MNEIISETMRTKGGGGDYRTIEEDAKVQILGEFCTDPNVDEDVLNDNTTQQTTRHHVEFCGECLWIDAKSTCNAKVENMVNVYSISRDDAIDAVLVDCTKEHGTNASISNISFTWSIAIAILAFILFAILIYVKTRKRIRNEAQTPSASLISIEMSKSKIGALVILGLAFISTIYRIQINITPDTRTISTTQKPDDAHLSICNRRVYLKNMPPLPPKLKFGFPNDWERSFTKLGGAIILDNEFLYGRTGNNIREFFHAFDWARNDGVGLVVRERGFPMDKVSKATITIIIGLYYIISDPFHKFYR